MSGKQLSFEQTAKRPPVRVAFLQMKEYIGISVVVSGIGIAAANKVSNKHLDNLVEEAEDCRPYTVSVAGAGALCNIDGGNVSGD